MGICICICACAAAPSRRLFRRPRHSMNTRPPIKATATRVAPTAIPATAPCDNGADDEEAEDGNIVDIPVCELTGVKSVACITICINGATKAMVDIVAVELISGAAKGTALVEALAVAPASHVTDVNVPAVCLLTHVCESPLREHSNPLYTSGIVTLEKSPHTFLARFIKLNERCRERESCSTFRLDQDHVPRTAPDRRLRHLRRPDEAKVAPRLCAVVRAGRRVTARTLEAGRVDTPGHERRRRLHVASPRGPARHVVLDRRPARAALRAPRIVARRARADGGGTCLRGGPCCCQVAEDDWGVGCHCCRDPKGLGACVVALRHVHRRGVKRREGGKSGGEHGKQGFGHWTAYMRCPAASDTRLSLV